MDKDGKLGLEDFKDALAHLVGEHEQHEMDNLIMRVIEETGNLMFKSGFQRVCKFVNGSFYCIIFKYLTK